MERGDAGEGYYCFLECQEFQEWEALLSGMSGMDGVALWDIRNGGAAPTTTYHMLYATVWYIPHGMCYQGGIYHNSM